MVEEECMKISPRFRRFFVAVACTSALAVAGFVAASPAAAAGGGYIDISDGHARVTATLSFTGSSSFTLTDVTLYDVSCDAKSAYFESWDDYGALAVHENSYGCGSSVHWTQLSGSAGGYISFVQLHTYACSTWSCSSGRWSGVYYNPY
jgi:hypothetical protein